MGMTSFKWWKKRIICQPRTLYPEEICHVPENSIFCLLRFGTSELNTVKQVSVLLWLLSKLSSSTTRMSHSSNEIWYYLFFIFMFMVSQDEVILKIIGRISVCICNNENVNEILLTLYFLHSNSIFLRLNVFGLLPGEIFFQ